MIRSTRTLVGAAVAALAFALSSGAAGAMPGQTPAQFEAWAKANPALHGLAKKTGEMSGLPYFTATFSAGSTSANFLANTADGKISDESVAVAETGGAYDMLKHLDTGASLLRAVYGNAVAADFTGAQKVGSWTLHGQSQATALFRGHTYGYEVAHAFVEVLPLARIDAEAKMLQSCVDTECGD